MSCMFCGLLFASDLLALGMSLLVHCEVPMVIETLLAELAPKFKHALMFLFMMIQKFFGIVGFSTVTAVEFSSIMAAHMLLVSSCAG